MEKIQREAHSSTFLDRFLPKTSHGWFMAACCILMVVGAGISFVGSSQDLTLPSALVSITPIAGCLAMHLIMHRFMGHSCHQATSKNKEKPR